MESPISKCITCDDEISILCIKCSLNKLYTRCSKCGIKYYCRLFDHNGNMCIFCILLDNNIKLYIK